MWKKCTRGKFPAARRPGVPSVSMRYEGVYPPGLLGGQLGNNAANKYFTHSPACRRCQCVTELVRHPGPLGGWLGNWTANKYFTLGRQDRSQCVTKLVCARLRRQESARIRVGRFTRFPLFWGPPGSGPPPAWVPEACRQCPRACSLRTGQSASPGDPAPGDGPGALVPERSGAGRR